MVSLINFNDMKFFKYGVEICNAYKTEYDGHTQWLANWLDVDYLTLAFNKWRTDRFDGYYDGYHHCKYLGFFCIAWGGRPYKD